MSEKYLTVRETAQLLRLSEKTVYTDAHKMGAKRAGDKSIRIPESGLKKYLKPVKK